MKIDLHVHLDPTRSLEQNIDYLSSIPVDGVGLNGRRDIEYIKSIRNRVTNRMVIVGQEIFSESFHIIALGINTAIDYKLSTRDTISQIHSQGGIAIAAHPFLKVTNILRLLRNIDQYGFDAIEGFNGLLGPFIIPNYLARAASRIKNMPWISASDAHRLEHIGSSYIDIPCDNPNDTAQIFQLIKNGVFTARNKSYFHFESYKRAVLGVRCAICKERWVFMRGTSEMQCCICGEVGRTNLLCKNGHYECDKCLLRRSYL